jgi:hypothetical protein
MSNIRPPLYELGNPQNGQFKRPRIEDNKRTLFVKSNLKARAVPSVYSSQKKRKELSSDEESNEEKVPGSSAASTSSTKPEPAFILPPTVDFSDFNAKLSKSTPSSKPSSAFQSPDDIHSTATPTSPKNAFQIPPEVDFTDFGFSSPGRKLCKFCRKGLPSTFVESPPVAARARYAYCQRHENASILENGKKKGYPSSFDFFTVQTRIAEMLPTIRKLLDGPTESEFLTNLRRKTARRNAAAPMIMIKLFEDSQPGYYGPKGGEMITEVVMDKFGEYIRNKKELHDGLMFCGGVMGFVSSVVVPEVGVRLIMKDMNVDWDAARKIMTESIPYGNAKNPSDEVVSDDDTDSD